MADGGEPSAPAWPTRIALLAWVAIACTLLVCAPAPPEPPTIDPEADAVRQRMADWALADARTWQVEQGDRTIPWSQARGHLAIIIDDVGRELRWQQRLYALRYRLSFSVLPGARYAAGAQERLGADHRRPRDILLHLPMEPLDADRMREGDEASEDFLRASDDPDTLRRKLRAALDRVPAAVGVNNHMGSRLTGDPTAMAAIMPELARRGLFFVDSRTSADTVAELAARDTGLPTAARDVFLDHDARRPAIEAALADAAARARVRPTIVIAHPSLELVEVLEARLPELFAQGIGVYPVGELVARVEGERRRSGTPAVAVAAPESAAVASEPAASSDRPPGQPVTPPAGPN